jgi:NDP-sugar pyrophosphorylase family protein
VSLPVAVLAGGLATRLRPLTEQIPKVLIDVAGQPFAMHQMELLRQQGVTEVVLCVGHLGEQVKAALGDGTRWGMRLRYVFDGPKLLGTGGALRRALPLLGPAFFVMYGDSYLTCSFAAVEAAFEASGQPALMTIFRNDNQWDRSNVAFAGDRILKYDKKHLDPSMHYIDYGLAVLTPSVFDGWPDGDQPLDLAEVYATLVGEGRMAGFEVSERFYEIGSHAGLEETRALLAGRGASA